MLVLAFVLMQFMISAKAGLVNYVAGQANVRLHEQVPAGTSIQTGSGSHVELLLNPGSFLRLDENSTVVLDSVELTNIAVRVVSGGALLEAGAVDKRTPIRITTGSLTVLVTTSGVYRFSGDTAAVLDGKLQTADSAITVKKGRQITGNGNQFEQTRIPASAALDGLDLWSSERSAELARANALAYNSQSAAGVYYPYGFYNGAGWLFSPLLSGFTYIPLRQYRSYYGYTFVPLFVVGSRSFAGLPGPARVPKPAPVPARPPQSAPATTAGSGARPATNGPGHSGAISHGSFGGPHGGGSHSGRSGGHGGHR